MTCCPTCGQGIPGGEAPIEALTDAKVPKQQREILRILVGCYPRDIGVEALIEIIWGNDPDGGPLDPRSVINTQLCRLRPAILKYGWTIPRRGGGSGNYGRYRLARVSN